MQRAKYEIGEEAVNRFSLPPEDKATLELVEWVDGAFKKASVADVVSRAADGTSVVQELDFSTLRAQTLLCIDVAVASSRSSNLSQKLLDQAQVMLSEIYPGRAPKMGATHWDQIYEIAIISVAKHLLKRLQELLEHEKFPVLQSLLTGDLISTSSKDFQRQGHRECALAMLHQMIKDAHMGKRQFLSGKLHNLARAIVDEENERGSRRAEGLYHDKEDLNHEKNGVLGLGLRHVSQPSSGGEKSTASTPYDVKDAEKRIYGPLTSKATTYLSQFILHIAAIGDIVDVTVDKLGEHMKKSLHVQNQLTECSFG